MNKNITLWKRNRAAEKYHLFPIVVANKHSRNRIKSVCEGVILQPFHLEMKSPPDADRCERCKSIDEMLKG